MAKSPGGQWQHINCQLAISTTTTPQIHAGIVFTRGTKNSCRHFGQKFGPSKFHTCTTDSEQCGQTQCAAGAWKAARQTDVARINTTSARQASKAANMSSSYFSAPWRRRLAVSRAYRIRHFVERAAGVAANGGDRRQAHHHDQGKHHRVFHGGRSVFGDKESSYLVDYRFHLTLHRVARGS